jgi:hypothetical protein
MKVTDLVGLVIFYVALFYAGVLLEVIDNSLRHASGVLILYVLFFFFLGGILQAFFSKLESMISVSFSVEEVNEKDTDNDQK